MDRMDKDATKDLTTVASEGLYLQSFSLLPEPTTPRRGRALPLFEELIPAWHSYVNFEGGMVPLGASSLDGARPVTL